tara:strand:+ start:439 stop:627 length:189 start_codon:yes stop_codon:yes gene_type:complete
MDLYLPHLIFITICATGSFAYGWMVGKKNSHREVIEVFLARGLITKEQLLKSFDYREPTEEQ